jgi:hypothetical protein
MFPHAHKKNRSPERLHKQGSRLEELRAMFQPFYLYFKAIHLFTVAMWAFSTVVAYRNYILPTFIAWERNPEDQGAIANRNLAIERFDKGAVLEHIAFPLVLLTGIIMVWLAGWPWLQLNWLGLKLLIIAVVFVPMEVVDYYISHGGGNKRRIRHSGDMQRYEHMIGYHWRFFRVTTPQVVIIVPLLFLLAVTKPL